MADLIEHGLYRYPETHGWCKHGLVIVTKTEAGFIAVDTYWGGSADGFYQWESIKDKVEFIIDTSKCRTSSRDEWERYSEKDRGFIPMGGGSEKWLILKDAKPNPELVVEQLAYEIYRKQGGIRFDGYEIDRKESEILDIMGAEPRPKNSKPIADQINALPLSMRDYIHELEMNSPIAIYVQEIAGLKDNVSALSSLVGEDLPKVAKVENAISQMRAVTSHHDAGCHCSRCTTVAAYDKELGETKC